MTEFKGFCFDVQIWEEDGKYNWAVCEEFEGDSTEFTPLGWGTADSFEEAAGAAADVVRNYF